MQSHCMQSNAVPFLLRQQQQQPFLTIKIALGNWFGNCCAVTCWPRERKSEKKNRPHSRRHRRERRRGLRVKKLKNRLREQLRMSREMRRWQLATVQYFCCLSSVPLLGELPANNKQGSKGSGDSRRRRRGTLGKRRKVSAARRRAVLKTSEETVGTSNFTSLTTKRKRKETAAAAAAEVVQSVRDCVSYVKSARARLLQLHLMRGSAAVFAEPIWVQRRVQLPVDRSSSRRPQAPARAGELSALTTEWVSGGVSKGKENESEKR